MTEGLFDLIDAIGQVERPDWMVDAACVGVDPDMFFDQWRTYEARQVCIRCPVRTDCRTHAFHRYLVDGVAESGMWGGLTEGERNTSLSVGHARNGDLDAEILRLAGQGVAEPKIAEVVGVNVRTVQRVKARARMAA